MKYIGIKVYVEKPDNFKTNFTNTTKYIIIIIIITDNINVMEIKFYYEIFF